MSVSGTTVRNAAVGDAESVYDLSNELSPSATFEEAQDALSAAAKRSANPNRDDSRQVLDNLARNIQSVSNDFVSGSLRNWSAEYLRNEDRSIPVQLPPSRANAPPLPTVRSTLPPPLPSRNSQPRRMDALSTAPPALPPRRRVDVGDFNGIEYYRDFYRQDVARRSNKFRLTKFQSVLGVVGGAALVAASISLIAEQNRSPTKQKKGVNIFAIVAAVIGSVGAFYSVSQLMQRDVPTLQQQYAAS